MALQSERKGLYNTTIRMGYSCLCQNKRKENEETKFLLRDKAMGSWKVTDYCKEWTIFAKQSHSKAMLGHGH